MGSPLAPRAVPQVQVSLPANFLMICPGDFFNSGSYFIPKLMLCQLMLCQAGLWAPVRTVGLGEVGEETLGP